MSGQAETKPNLWYRARLAALRDLVARFAREEAGATDKREANAAALRLSQARLGHWSPDWSPTEDAAVASKFAELYPEEFQRQMAGLSFQDPALTDLELSLNSTWFARHPEKLLGVEVATTSREFSVTTKGSREATIAFFERYTNRQNTQEMENDIARAIALKMRLLNARLSQGHTVGDRPGLHGLGSLGKSTQAEVDANAAKAMAVVRRSRDEESAGGGKTISFAESVERYNQGITEEEIQAWVWYKRSMGVPMTGWEAYFLSGRGEKTAMLQTTRATVIRDNRWRELYTAPPGKTLGRFLDKRHQVDPNDKGSTWLLFRDDQGIKLVQESAVRIVKSDTSFATADELRHLVMAGALFHSDGELLPFPIYAYDNMYDSQLQLERDRPLIESEYGAEVFARHMEVVVSRRPQQLSIMNPDPRERPRILAISDFSKEFNVESLRPDSGIELDKAQSLRDAFTEWLRKLPSTEFATSSAHNIITHYLLAKNVMDKSLDADQKKELKANARNDGEELFARFLYEALAPEDQKKLDFTWNRLFNGQATLAFHKIPVGFQASRKFKGYNLELRPAQREGVAYMSAVGSGIIAYDVGVGKTMTAIIAMADAIFSGRVSRPLVVVPNPTYGKWMQELVGYTDKKGRFVEGILSHTGITVNDWYNLGSEASTGIDLNRKVAAGSITLVTYEGMKKIGFSKRVMDEMFDELANILGQSSAGLSQRDSEINYVKLEEMIGVGRKGTIADIDTLGLDMLVIDEAHRCKNIFEGVKADASGKKRFGLTGAVSEVGQKAFFLCNFMQRRFGRNVMLLTATPFTNSPLEIYSMLSLVANDSMKRMNIANIDTFFQMFVLETTEYVVDYKEQIVAKDVIKRFNNRLILQKLIYNHITYKTGEEAGVRRPCKVNLPRVNAKTETGMRRLVGREQLLTYLSMTPAQRENQNLINALVREATDRKFNQAAIFRAMNDSLDNALSPFLFEGNRQPEDHIDFVEGSPKIKYCCDCIASVKQYHERRGEPVSGQVIYMNRGKDYFPLLVEYLERVVGYKRDVRFGNVRLNEVEVITSESPTTKKENIKEAFLAGVVKVVIGTATIREGIDLQTKGTVLYNLYASWNPTDIRQLEGRIWRQGNEFGYVRVVMPLVQDSMDVFVFQKLEEKTTRINDIWYRGDRGNVLDLESLDPEEVKYALMTDVNGIASMMLKGIKAEIERRQKAVAHNIQVLGTFATDYKRYQSYRANCIQMLDEWHKKIMQAGMLQHSYTEEELAEKPRDWVEQYRDLLALRGDLDSFAEAGKADDRELLRLHRKCVWQRFTSSWADTQFNYFKEYLAKVKQAEKTILKQKGYDLNADIPKVIDELKADLARIEEELRNAESEQFFSSLVSEVRRKKSAIAIEGASIADRVAEFASLNYLLSFGQSDVDANFCALPGPESERPPKDSSMEMDAAKARALVLKLNLLKMRF